MAESRLRHDWDHTAQLVSLILNSLAAMGGTRSKPITPNDVHPYRSEPSAPAEKVRMPVSDWLKSRKRQRG